MATSSCDKFSTEFGELTLQPSVNEDSDDGECSLRSPNVRAYIASFELHQHRQHRPLCRTDDIGRYQHRYLQRPQPPCKTTSAVLKARHLRAASEDFSTSWKSTDHSEVAVIGRSVAELKVALLNSANHSSDQNGSRLDPSQDDISVEEPTSLCEEQNVTIASEYDDNEVDERSWNGTEHVHSSATTITDTAVDCSLRRYSSNVDKDEPQSATDGGVDVVDFTGDDVGYFSLPVRRPDRNTHQTARSRSVCWHLRHNSATIDDDEVVDPPLAYSSDSAGSISPTIRTSGDHRRQADVSSFGICVSEDEHCQSYYEAPQCHVNASSSTISGCSDHVIPDNSPPRSECTAHDQHSDEVTAEEDDQKIHVEDNPVVHRRNSVPLANIEPERLSDMMMASFGRCDEVLCRAIGAVDSYNTALSYVSSLYAESCLIQQCTFDLSRPCQLDAISTGVQFLTLEAVREAATQYLQRERDAMIHVKETMDNEENLLLQLDAHVAGVIKCKTDSRQLEKYRQYVDEMERVTRLLLLLAGRLARFDNSLLQLPPSGDSQSNSLKSLTTSRDELMEKLADASTLKSDIDRRGEVISDQIASCLSTDEFADYQRLMVEKIRLRLQRQELEDWLRLAEHQLKELSFDVDDCVQDLTSHC